MPKRIKSRKKSKRKIKRQKKKNKRHLLSVIHGSWLKVLVARRPMLTQSDSASSFRGAWLMAEDKRNQGDIAAPLTCMLFLNFVFLI